MTVNTKLNLVNYMIMVDAIAAEYFDDHYVYTPQYGRLNAMRLFWNNCVKDHPLSAELGHEIQNAEDMEQIISDDAFINVYQTEIFYNDEYFCFGSAYNDALTIVEDKKSSIGRVVSAFEIISDTLAPVLTKENIIAAKSLVGNINNGKIDPKLLEIVAAKLAK